MEESDVKMQVLKIIVNLNDISFIKIKSNFLIDSMSIELCRYISQYQSWT
ncbi:hypothetical protein [Candidatus Hodgkinia cicadicola]